MYEMYEKSYGVQKTLETLCMYVKPNLIIKYLALGIPGNWTNEILGVKKSREFAKLFFLRFGTFHDARLLPTCTFINFDQIFLYERLFHLHVY